MLNRTILSCYFLCAASFGQVVGDDRISVGFDEGDPKVTRENAGRIEQALKSSTDCAFKDKPLNDAMRSFGERHQFTVWLDKQALSDEGINSDQPVTLVASGISLEAALRLTLEPLGLAYCIRDGILIVTTQAKTDEMMSTRIYPVGDLVISDYKPLMELIMNTTSGKWMALDQEGGAINPFRNARSLVIRQTQQGHREIEGVLSALRQAKKLQHRESLASDLKESTRLKKTPPSAGIRRPPSNVPTQQPPSNYQPPRFFSAGG